MQTVSNQLIKLLEQNPEKTCFVLKHNQIVFTSEQKGVKPMMDYYSSYGSSTEPLTVVDRIIGKGAIILAILIGADQVITPIISQVALDFATKSNIKVKYCKIVPFIINRTKDGQCPIECSVTHINDIHEGYEAIRKTLLKLNTNKGTADCVKTNKINKQGDGSFVCIKNI
ncbi:DUF1893 domain-containing protein [Abyssisolibacter fermentans]|uniref:DUF1893 domain-containing protein n=1 Tax=Abyssisolibacter fermentans TaxID=1766203 RepID=UPI00082E36F5|nr:DUF1893 domain-containing protein [Abyssisolibacter fermentans]